MYISKVSSQNFGQIYDYSEARKYMIRMKKKLPLVERVQLQDKIDNVIASKFMDVYIEFNGDIYTKNKITGVKYNPPGHTAFERFCYAVAYADKIENGNVRK